MAGTGSIRKLGEKRYYIRISLGYDEEGKRQEHREVFNGTKGDAQRRVTEVLGNIQGNTYAKPTKATVQDYLRKWLSTAAKLSVRPRTFQDYTDIVEKRIIPAIGSIPLDKLNPMKVQEFYNELSEKLAPKTVRNVHVVLHSALKKAVIWRMLVFNPSQDVELPRRVRNEMGALDSIQAQKFNKAAKKFPLGIAYLVALAGGMRPAEYLALKWTDLNLDSGEVRVQRTIFRPRGGGWVFEECKTAKSRRSLILPRKLMPTLREHRTNQIKQRLAAGNLWTDHDLVFTNETGGPLEGCNLNKRVFKLILKEAELPLTLRPYDLRHSCATLLLEAGKSPKLVAERLGHASTVMTMDVYSHVTPTMQQDAANALDRVF